LNALVVGHGRMGRYHAQTLASLGLAVTTEDPVAPADVSRLSGRERRRFDVICIAVPIEALADVAYSVVGHEGWLLVEKPFAATVRDARDLGLALDGQQVAVGYVERFNPQAVRLKQQLAGREATGAVFVRCNDRPTASLGLDLRSHDLDLAYWLDIPSGRCAYVTTADGPTRRREIHVDLADGGFLYADLMDHAERPLRAQWDAFLNGRPGVASVEDAVRVLDRLRPAVPVAV
jgi:predicted dehydrogenase